MKVNLRIVKVTNSRMCTSGRKGRGVRAIVISSAGIYDDPLRAGLIAEHSTTTVKSMKKIVVLSKQNPVNYDQLIHWNSKGSDQSDRGKDRKAFYGR